MVRDMTERRLAEEALRLSQRRLAGILDIAQDAIISVDDTRTIRLFNKGAERIFGYAAYETIGRRLDLLLPNSQSLVEAIERRTNSPSAAPAERQEVSARRRDGSEFPAELSASKFQLGEETVFTLILRDVSDRRRAELERANLLGQFHQAQKMEAIGRLAGGIAHDFNNVLAAILGYADLALYDIPPDTPAASNVQQVLKAGRSGKTLVRQILAFSRREERVERSVRLDQVLHEALDLMAATLPKTIEVERRSLATGAILVGIVTVLAALTLLPAVLALLGDRVNALRIPWLGRRIERSAGTEGRVWSHVVRSVIRAPWLAAVLSVAFLVAAALPILTIETGLTGVRELPDRFHAKRGFTMLEQSFGVGTPDSVQIVVEGDVRSAPLRASVAELARRVGRAEEFLPADVSISPDGRLAKVEALVAGDSRDERALAAVERLRTDVAPSVLAGRDAEVLVTGETAEVLDYRHLTDRWLPIVFVFVLGLSFVLLTVAFRTIVLPAVAIALNLLSVGAAYGLIVLVFLHGVGRDFLGFTEVDVIAAWLPLFLFAVLFGLSMDYTVFLLSRIRERVAIGERTTEAVVHGVSSTARIITGAALIIIAVFVGFATGDQVEFQQMGFGIAVSLFIDATLVRLVLLPAVLALLGERTWYLPRRLGWLPHVEIEGHR